MAMIRTFRDSYMMINCVHNIVNKWLGNWTMEMNDMLDMQSCCASFWLTGGRGCLKNTRQGGQKQKKNQKAKN